MNNDVARVYPRSTCAKTHIIRSVLLMMQISLGIGLFVMLLNYDNYYKSLTDQHMIIQSLDDHREITSLQYCTGYNCSKIMYDLTADGRNVFICFDNISQPPLKATNHIWILIVSIVIIIICIMSLFIY